MTRKRASKWLYHLLAEIAKALEDADVLHVLLEYSPRDQAIFLNAAKKLADMFARKSLGDWPDITDEGQRLRDTIKRFILERGKQRGKTDRGPKT